MGIYQGQIGQTQEPSSVRRPTFPKGLYDERRDEISGKKSFSSSKFIDPATEIQRTLIVPEQTISSPIISLEIARATTPKKGMKSESLFATIYEYFFAAIEQLKRKFGRNRRARARLTRLGTQTLDQLRYLSLLCDATACRTPEEALEAESAFGEAYFEIMTLSSNLEKMSEREGERHLRNYANHISKVLRAAD